MPRNIVVFVADGLRPGSVNPTDAPTLYSLRQEGVNFTNSHSLFPTFTTPNASAIATGHYLGDTGDFSNTVYTGYPVPNANGSVTPFIENDPILADINANANFADPDLSFSKNNFLTEESLLAYARLHGYSTAAIGKLGPVAIQDITQVSRTGGDTTAPNITPKTVIIDDSTNGLTPPTSDATGSQTAVPLSQAVADRLTAAGLPLTTTPRVQPAGNLTTPGTFDANVAQQQYFADATTKAVLPQFVDDIASNTSHGFAAVYWSRDPDGTQHNNGDAFNPADPGNNFLDIGINGPTPKKAVTNADANLKQIIDYLKATPDPANPGKTLYDNTDLFVTSDHGFSTISKQAVGVNFNAAGTPTYTDTTSYASTLDYYTTDSDGNKKLTVHPGFLPPGFVAIDLAHDLGSMLYDPNKPTAPVNPSNINNIQYTAVDPTQGQLPLSGNGVIGGSGQVLDGVIDSSTQVVVAANGGSDLLYVPSKDPALVKQIVSLLAQKDYISGIFTDDQFGDVPGALKLSTIGLEGSSELPTPSIIVNFKTFSTNPNDPNDPQAEVQVADTTLQQGQGMHGSFGRGDTFNNMAAIGPDFKSGFVDTAPVSNVDLVPTLASVLGWELPAVGSLTGRVLNESLVNGPDTVNATTTALTSSPIDGKSTTLKVQKVGNVPYFDAAGFANGTDGLIAPIATNPPKNSVFSHVLIISVDGLHNSDLSEPSLQSSLTNVKRLQGEGITYSNAFSSAPSDSFPGELNYITGANPGTTGVLYDKSYSRVLYAPGTTAAEIAAGTATSGTGVEFAENVDASWNNGSGGTLDGGQGFDTTQLPVDSSGNLVYPNQYLNVNTIFDVANAAGLKTAWSDKHPAAYTILAGNTQDPTKFDFATGKVGSIDDYSSLEINAAVAIDPTKPGPLPTSLGALVDQSTGTPFSNTNPNITSDFFNDATKGNKALFGAPPSGFSANQFSSVATTSTYDDYKVKQILNEIDGLDHTGTTASDTPAIFGLNLQAVSVAEKEPATLFNGGGIDASGKARPDLVSAVSHTDASIGLILDELKKKGLDDSTLVVLTAKHGQNPVQDPTVGLNSAFDSMTGEAGGDEGLTAFGALLAKNGIEIAAENGGDTSSLLFLKNKSDVQKAVDLLNSKDYSFDTAADLVSDPTGNTLFSTEDAAAQETVLYGKSIVTSGLGDPYMGDRTPDIVVPLNEGYFFGNATKKRAEHGGFTDADTHVALITGSTGLSGSLQGTTDTHTVSTTQVAPTVLEALGLDPNLLEGAQRDGTPDLGVSPTAFVPANEPTAVGTSGNDFLVATPGTVFNGQGNTVFTGAGNDTVDTAIAGTSAGNNRIDLGSGDDTAYAANGDRIFGGSGNDTLDATDAKNYRLSGGAGDDILFGGSKGYLLGGDGSDRLFVGSGGDNLLSGGAGADQFWIVDSEIPSAPNTILDFQRGTDAIGIQGAQSLGISAETLALTQIGTDTLVGFGGQTLAVLSGIQANSLNLSDAHQFVFA